MVRISITAAFVASLALSAFATPTARESVIKVPVKKVHASSAKAVVSKDQARLAKANGYAASSGAITNEVDSYLAAVKVGSQTFNLIVDTGMRKLFARCVGS
jgi:hypothetical protein